jgi:surfactin synthase thioesterase subunit/NAD(P)-dependent dehydrogenase (short-subunit alcohol dehydrogenase family)/acyl carrier protein
VHGVGDLLALVQGVIMTARVLPLWVVTCQAEPVQREGSVRIGEAVNLAQTPLWGFARTLFLEHPELRGGMIDLEAKEAPAARAGQVVRQVRAGDLENQVAFRGGERLIAQLVPAHPAGEAPPLKLRGDGAYLVTGGLGGLGLKCALWLAENGARRILLAGRRLPPARETWDTLPAGSEASAQVRQIREIEARGAQVELVAADVRDAAQLGSLLERARAGGAPLRGVLHAAGVNWFGKVREMDRQALLDSLKVKVSAGWRLHELTREDDLDLFLLFSSVSAIWGSVDLSHYTAANHFLDALSHHRRAETGGPALSVDWGPWAEVGMSAKEHEVALLTKLGFALLEPARAQAAMQHLLASDSAQSVVADIDWNAFRFFIDFAAPSLFARVADAGPRAAASAPKPRDADLIRTAPAAEAHAHLHAVVRQQLAAVMLFDGSRTIDVNQRFNFLGMDSLMAIAFAARLEKLLGVKVPAMLAYNFPTLQTVTDHLYELVRGAPPESPLEGVAVAQAPVGLEVHPRRPEPREAWLQAGPGSERASLRLFCLPYAGGGASAFASWRAALAPEIAVVPVQLPGREERVAEAAIRDMGELVSRLADAVGDRWEAPFALFGHSLGGLIAFELTRELRRRSLPQPEQLILSACAIPHPGESRQIHRLPEEELILELAQTFGFSRESLRDPALRQALLPTVRADVTVLESYQLAEEPPLACPLLLLGGTNDLLVPPERLLEWKGQTTAGVSLRLLSGDHMFIRGREADVLAVLRRELHRPEAPRPVLQPLLATAR